MSNKRILLLAVIFGLLTALTLNYYLQQVKEAATRRQTQKVVVAVAAIPAKSIVTKEMVALQDVPLEYAHASAVTDVNQVVGNIARAEIVAGEQVLKEKLLPQKSSIGGLSNLIPLGMRAVSIPVSDITGVSGLVVPGDRVDLIGTIELATASLPAAGNGGAGGQAQAQAGEQKTTVTHLLMQNVEVLAVGKNLQPTVVTENDANKVEGALATITLAVPPAKVQVVAMFLEKGKVSVALRSPADRAIHSRPLFRDVELLK